jgi:hypothetical protein
MGSRIEARLRSRLHVKQSLNVWRDAEEAVLGRGASLESITCTTSFGFMDIRDSIEPDRVASQNLQSC